jgi:hypothetical protein
MSLAKKSFQIIMASVLCASPLTTFACPTKSKHIEGRVAKSATLDSHAAEIRESLIDTAVKFPGLLSKNEETHHARLLGKYNGFQEALGLIADEAQQQHPTSVRGGF